MSEARGSNCGGCLGLITLVAIVGGVIWFMSHNEAPPPSPPVVSNPATNAPPQPQATEKSVASFVRTVHDRYGMLTLADGTSYFNVTVTKVDPSGITFLHDAGVSTVPFEQFSDKGMPPDIRKIYGFDPALAETFRKAHTQVDGARPQTEADTYMAALQPAGIDNTLVKSVLVTGDSLSIVVTDPFNTLPYQTRLQDAQNFQKVWGTLHSPDHPNAPSIHIIDFKGTEVGGTGPTGIWVQAK